MKVSLSNIWRILFLIENVKWGGTFLMARFDRRVIFGRIGLGVILFILFQGGMKECAAQENEAENRARIVLKIDSETFSEEKPETFMKSDPADSAQSAFEGGKVLFLEVVWLKNAFPREALLVVPENKVPMILVRVLDEEERLTRLWAARTELSSSNEDSDGILAECFEPKIIWGDQEGDEKEVPELIVISGTRGAVDLDGNLSPCLVLPVTSDNESAILEKYLNFAEKSEEGLK